MKKKLIVATALVLVFAISMTLFVGCDEIFKKNDKRDAQQVVASVTYNGEFGKQTENVYKFELASSFNSYAYYYVNYYGMTYEAAANSLAQSLAQQKLLVLFAKRRSQNSKARIRFLQTSKNCFPQRKETKQSKIRTRVCSIRSYRR